METINRRIGIVLVLLGIFAISGVAFGVGYRFSETQYKKAVDRYLSDLEISHQEIETTNDKVKSLSQIVLDSSIENKALLEVIASLRGRPSDVERVTEIISSLEPLEPEIVTPELPDLYLFRLKEGPTVAAFQTVNDKYKFDTYQLNFYGTLASNKRSTSVLLEVESSYQPGVRYEVPITVRSTRVGTPVKFLDPQIGIGITGSVPLSVTASAYGSILHPSAYTDIASARISFNAETIKAGLDPISYNVGRAMPILQDLWVQPGVSINLNQQFSFDLTIGSKL